MQHNCSRIIIIEEGSIIADDSPQVLADELSPRRIINCSFRLDGDREKLSGLFEKYENIECQYLPKESDDLIRICISVGKDSKLATEEISGLLTNAGARLTSFNEKVMSLEEIFLAYLRKHGEGEDDEVVDSSSQ